jgi:hypothetical protein
MRSHYQPPCDKQYFHTKPKMGKRDMEILKKKVLRIQQKKNIIRYEERLFRG